MSTEQAAEQVAQRHAAGDAGRGRHGVLEKTSAPGLRGRGAPRATLRRGRGLRLRRLRRISGRRRGLRPALVGRCVIARMRRRGRRSSAKDRFAEIAEEAALLLLLFSRVLRGRFEFGDPLGRRLQGVLLNEHGLSEDVRREGGGANRVVDKGFRLRVARRGARRADAVEKTAEHLAFFGGHVTLPYRPPRPRPAYGHWLRSIQDGAIAFFAPAPARGFTPADRSSTPVPQFTPAPVPFC
jgi:hypothetical protein